MAILKKVECDRCHDTGHLLADGTIPGGWVEVNTKTMRDPSIWASPVTHLCKQCAYDQRRWVISGPQAEIIEHYEDKHGD
jgi:hypothetical protein